MVPDASEIDLDEIGLYAVGYAYRGQPETQFPLGWSGDFEEATGVSCIPAGSQGGRRAFLLHPPWRGGTGIAFQEFVFALPRASRIVLRGAAAMRSDIVGKSDGATFRVFAAGRKLLETHRVDDTWAAFEFDLTHLGGAEARIRFETDPGPRNDASFDFSLWGARELVLSGYSPPPRANPAPPPLALDRMGPEEGAGVAPRSGFSGATSIELAGDVATLRYEGADGTLAYRWEVPRSAEPLFGALSLTARQAGSSEEAAVPLANSARISWTRPAAARASWFQRSSSGVLLVRPFDVGGTPATVRIEGSLVRKSLVLRVTCDAPLAAGLDAGVWGPVVRRRPVPLPYYSGRAHFFPHENLFANAFLDWTDSSASSHDGTRAAYGALTDGARNPLRERAVFAAAWHLAEVLPNIPNPPSPHRSRLADRIVLDVWGGSFASIAAKLSQLADAGVDRAVALVHVWQRSGYDNALPAHIPANAALGGDEAMRELVATGRRLGIPVALHENYVDYYPNYDDYDERDVALDSEGRPVKAWYNPSTGIQSFAVKPTAILRLASTQSPEIHTRYGTEACYLDVHSAVPPWFHVDFRAGEPGAGTFRRVWDAHRELFAYERATHGGPVFGEGANHWYWSGCLDGVEAQFGWDPETGASVHQGMTAPLAVDFDLLRIHPLQANHGMGYYERWWPEGFEAKLAGPPPMAVLDQYRMQEIAFGHAGFLGSSTWSVLPLAWLEARLVGPVSARAAAARVLSILYDVGTEREEWADISAAFRASGAPRFDRVRVAYEGGLVVTANGREEPLRVGELILPRFGWLAQGPGFAAGTVLRDGVVADFSDSGVQVFANARNPLDWYLSSFRRVRPAVTFAQTAARTFRATYSWAVEDRLERDYRAFVHFAQAGKIVWQQDHALATPTSRWEPGRVISDGPWTIAVPQSVPDGPYDWLVGLFDLATGERVRLQGFDDGSSRIRLGTLRVEGGGAALAFEPETRSGEDPSALYRERLNSSGQPVDFGPVRTDGSVWIREGEGEWTLKPWPRERSFLVELDPARFGRPAAIRSVGGSSAEVVPVPAGARWRLTLNGAREYRWSAAVSFRRADANADGEIDLSDPVAILGSLFLGAPDPVCPDANDANDDGTVDISDAVYALAWLFLGGPEPAAPGPSTCGLDPTADDLSACAYPDEACPGR